MNSKNKSNWPMYFLLGSLFCLIIGIVAIYYYDSSNDMQRLDGEMIPGPYQSGDITVEVDYMDSCSDTSELESVLAQVSNIYAAIGINVTFIVDDKIAYIESVNSADITWAYLVSQDENCDCYLLIASSFESTDHLGVAYSLDKIAIFYDSIEDNYGNTYKQRAMVYTIAHEIGHTYGSDHCDKYDCIMYPYLSITRVAIYPDPTFCDECTTEITN